jgi:hypothetical protein
MSEIDNYASMLHKKASFVHLFVSQCVDYLADINTTFTLKILI